MQQNEISKASIGRIPVYLSYLKNLPEDTENISAAAIARSLSLGEVQVRKDLSAVCGFGKPKVGFVVSELISSIEGFLGTEDGDTIIIGAGKLGRALLDYRGFSDFGLRILAAFDNNVSRQELSQGGNPILPMSGLADFCKVHRVRIGIIAVPSEAAQEVCNQLYENQIKAMLCFAPCRLSKPEDVVIQYENLALSLAHLKMQIK